MSENTEYIYHYTSLRGLTGIIKDKKLWATDSRFLNDFQEIKKGFECFISNKDKILTDILQMAEDSRKSTNFINSMKSLFNDFNISNKSIAEEEAIFITSFTKKRDSLTHWLSYGGKETSYCIKVNKDKLKNPAHFLKDTQQDIFSVEYLNTDFDSAEINKLTIKIYENFIEIGQLNHKFNGNAEKILGRFLFELYQELLFTCSSIKHEKYVDEEEDRLVLIKPGSYRNNGGKSHQYYSDIESLNEENHFSFEVKTRPSNGILIPYVEAPFDIDLIEEIIIGPSKFPKEAEIGLEFFCQEHNLKTKITFTECPFRAL